MRGHILTQRKRIFIHAGLHKTGTSFLQQTLARSRDKLEKLGVSYPTIGTLGDAHHNLAWEVRKDRKNTHFDPKHGSLSQLAAFIHDSPYAHFIISSEDFDYLNRPSISLVFEALAEFETKVVVYIRNQIDMISSNYKQLSRNVQQPVDEFLEKSLNTRKYTFDLHFQKWADYARAENVDFRLYENARENLLVDFLRATEIDLTAISIPSNTSVNRGEDLREIDLLREVRNAARCKGIAISPRIREEISEEAQHRGWTEISMSVLNVTQARRVIEHFRESNTRTEEIIGPLTCEYFELADRRFGAARLSEEELRDCLDVFDLS